MQIAAIQFLFINWALFFNKEAPILYLKGICFSENPLIHLFGGMGKNTQIKKEDSSEIILTRGREEVFLQIGSDLSLFFKAPEKRIYYGLLVEEPKSVAYYQSYKGTDDKHGGIMYLGNYNGHTIEDVTTRIAELEKDILAMKHKNEIAHELTFIYRLCDEKWFLLDEEYSSFKDFLNSKVNHK